MINDTLLISCPGEDGGLFLANGSMSARLSFRPVTGLFFGGGNALCAYQDNGGKAIRVSNGGFATEQDLASVAMDLHDLLAVDDLIFAAVTEDNSVVCFDRGLNEVESWVLPGEKDSAHLNSIVLYEGRLLASVFGRFRRHRQYKEGTRGQGEVIDVRSGETFIEGLSQPHSLTVVEDLLYLCSSEDREIRIYRGSKLLKVIPVPGYARGLAVGDAAIYVGLSVSRNTPVFDHDTGSAAVGVIDREQMSFEGAINLECHEIYDIRIIGKDTWVIPHLIDGSLDAKVRDLKDNLSAYKNGYEAYKKGYEVYKNGYEAYKKGYEVYKNGYEACKDGYEIRQCVESSLAWRLTKQVFKIENRIQNLFKFCNK